MFIILYMYNILSYVCIYIYYTSCALSFAIFTSFSLQRERGLQLLRCRGCRCENKSVWGFQNKRVLFIGTQFSKLYTTVDTPARAARYA